MPVGARVAERARVRASVRVNSQDHFRPALRQPTLKRGRLYPAAVGVCFALRNLLRFDPHRWRSNFLTCWAFQFCCWKFYCRFCFCFSLLSFPPPPHPRAALHALCSNIRSEMAGTREKLICVISFSERDGSEQPCSQFVLFELCRSLFSQAEYPDRIHS